MKKTEARVLLLEELTSFFIEYGYKKEKIKLAGFKKIDEYGYNRFYFDLHDYNPIQKVHFYVFKKINLVDNIYELLHQHFVIHPALSEISSTISFSYESLNGLNSVGYLPEIREKKDVEINANQIKQFMNQTGLSLLEKYNNLNEIDKEINRELFWKDDWRKPFNLSGGFAFKRLIIAYLCGNPRFEDLYNYHNGLFDYSNKEFPVQIVDGKNSIEYLRTILESSGKWNVA